MRLFKILNQKREEFEAKTKTFYLHKMEKESKQFENCKDKLLSLILKLNESSLESWTYKMRDKGYSKKSIYEILCDLHTSIQQYPSTKDEDVYYDFLSDFLDRFTAWGKHLRILPNEPDCE